MKYFGKPLVYTLVGIALSFGAGCRSKECPLISVLGPTQEQKNYLNSWHENYGAEVNFPELKDYTNKNFTQRQSKKIAHYAKKYMRDKNKKTLSDCELLGFKDITEMVEKYYKH